jgi:DNA repair protein RecO (recombination protein O)
MARIVRDEALILRSRRFRDTSLIVTVLCRHCGKQSLLARGARRPKSTFGASLETFTRSQVIFYRRELKELYTLSSSEIIDDYAAIRASPRKIIGAQVICEFLDRTSAAGQVQSGMYPLAITALDAAARTTTLGQLKSVLYSFLLLGLAHLGFRPHLSKCVRCGRRAANLFSVAYGGLVCKLAEDRASHVLPPRCIADLRRVYEKRRPVADLTELAHLDRLVRSYLQYHVEGLELGTLRFFDKMGLVAS